MLFGDEDINFGSRRRFVLFSVRTSLAQDYHLWSPGEAPPNASVRRASTILCNFSSILIDLCDFLFLV
jgi:hypothetical protein